MKTMTQTTFTIILGSILLLFTQCNAPKEPPKEEALLKIVESFTKNLPIQVDAETRFDTCELEGKKLTFHYTISDSIFSVADFEEMAAPSLKSSIKDNPNIEVYREHGITLRYRYSNINGDFLYDMTLEPSDY